MTITNESLTQKLFNALLLRDPSSEESTYWTTQLELKLATPGSIVLLGASSAEFTGISLRIGALFQAAFGRYGTTEELMAWRQIYDTGLGLTEIGQLFINSSEFRQAHPAATSSADFLSAMAQVGLGRDATQPEIDLFAPLIDSGALNYGDLLLEIININDSGLSVGLAMLSAGVNTVAPEEAEINSVGRDIPTAINTILSESVLLATVPGDSLSCLESNGELTLSGELTGEMVLDLGRMRLTVGGENRALDSGDLTGVISVSAENLTGEIVTFIGSAQDETYTASAQGDSIRGGGGNDVLTGGPGSDQFIFEITSVANGQDTIENFQLGASKDILDFSAFLNQANTANIDAIDADSIAEIVWANGDILTVVGYDLTTAADIAALFGAGSPFAAPAARGKAVVIAADIVGDARIWYLVNNSDLANITVDELSQVGLLVGVNNLGLVGFDASNFV